jgi:inorganic pyrophosphatase
MIDGKQADDKIIAVLKDDVVYTGIRDIDACPVGLIDRLKHYFLSYKQLPGDAPRRVEIVDVYNRAEALEVVGRSVRDYINLFGDPDERLVALRAAFCGEIEKG